MKDIPPVDPFESERLLAKRRPRRREHRPKPNLATWLVIAWLAFMAAWGCKHLYRQWSEAEPTHDNAAATAEVMHNATGRSGAGIEIDVPAYSLHE